MHGTSSAWRVPGYSEVRELGAGAAGRVVMARHDADGVLVAIKYLSDELRSDVGFVARFRHEARLLHTLSGPHTVQLYDYVESGAGAAIVMELVNGVALRSLLRSEGPTGPEAALAVLKGSLLGLAAAHAAGVVHRDFKPENVMVDADGTSKLVDFGIALRSGDGDAPAGTPPYMAPEQWLGGPAGPATDVYAATVVFFECLTGTRPFRATNIAALTRQHQSMPPPVEEVPPALQGLIERGLAKHPADRPPTATAFLTELEAVAADAYGPDWQRRGLRRLASMATLLAPFFPLDSPAPRADTSLARTDLGSGTRSDTRSGTRSDTQSDLDLDLDDRDPPFGRLGIKILAAIGCIAVIGGVTAALINVGGATEARSQSSVSTQDPTPSEILLDDPALPVDETEEPEETPSAEDTPTKSPTESPSTTAPATVPTVAPTAARSTPTPTASRTPTKKPTTRPTTRPTARPTTRPTAEPSPTPSSEDSSVIDRPDSPADSPSSAPTAAPTRTANEPTTAPTVPGDPPTSDRPEPTQGTPQEPRLTIGPATPPVETAPATLLALGLVTSGTVPFTLAVKRGVTGRHRRRR
ncbi:serine/threonine-protein kinase [Streptosporangium becharense]|uniref:non-specific serine/threonine protein kinase n=1 Tax=Streptosporangium becharense TaxID=1816182 RepID=A0A7W9IKI5_9ACTN|nr:serine/threonine-protein kinase [Streptosporangium becharense]MBB2911159.1 serine/threonine-protein kinase [Streptosporangium becharense]MBB5821783.1 serine/threonine-protein kinase [Streptosporangium becharense]